MSLLQHINKERSRTARKFIIDFSSCTLYNTGKYESHFLPPGKEFSVRVSIVRPWKIESSDAIFFRFQE